MRCTSWRFLSALLSGVLFTAIDARAETIRETLEEFHLFGTWSPNCDIPPTQMNAWIEYLSSAEGGVTHRSIVDEDGKSYNSPVLSARRVAPDRLALAYKFGDRTASLLMEFRGDRHRTLDARAGEIVNIEAGILKSTGKETEWMLRCR
jgi:hypothetical protein